MHGAAVVGRDVVALGRAVVAGEAIVETGSPIADVGWVDVGEAVAFDAVVSVGAVDSRGAPELQATRRAAAIAVGRSRGIVAGSHANPTLSEHRRTTLAARRLTTTATRTTAPRPGSLLAGDASAHAAGQEGPTEGRARPMNERDRPRVVQMVAS